LIEFGDQKDINDDGRVEGGQNNSTAQTGPTDSDRNISGIFSTLRLLSKHHCDSQRGSSSVNDVWLGDSIYRIQRQLLDRVNDPGEQARLEVPFYIAALIFINAVFREVSFQSQLLLKHVVRLKASISQLEGNPATTLSAETVGLTFWTFFVGAIASVNKTRAIVVRTAIVANMQKDRFA
jgi:hypothetical protein